MKFSLFGLATLMSGRVHCRTHFLEIETAQLHLQSRETLCTRFGRSSGSNDFSEDVFSALPTSADNDATPTPSYLHCNIANGHEDTSSAPVDDGQQTNTDRHTSPRRPGSLATRTPAHQNARAHTVSKFYALNNVRLDFAQSGTADVNALLHMRSARVCGRATVQASFGSDGREASSQALLRLPKCSVSAAPLFCLHFPF
jgi:hypothetical protein